MSAQDLMETLADRVQGNVRDAASDFDRAARAAADRAQAEAARAFDRRLRAERQDTERQRKAAAVGIALLLIVVGVAIFVARRRRSRRVQRLVRQARRAWGRSAARPQRRAA